MKINLVGCITPNYLNRSQAFFDTVGLMQSCNKDVVLVGFDKWKHYGDIYSLKNDLTYHHLSLPENHSHLMIQSGEFLDALPHLKQDEVVCLVDMDVYFQRDFAQEETDALVDKVKDGNTVAAYYNSNKYDTIEDEAVRIEVDPDWQKKWAHAEGNTTCMNCGVMVGTVGMFRKVQELYGRLCKDYYNATPNRARCQYLINLCWAKLGIKVEVLPDCIHQHGHFGLQPMCKWKNDKLLAGDKEVVIVHHFKKTKTSHSQQT